MKDLIPHSPESKAGLESRGLRICTHMLCGAQYAAVATQIGIAARQEAPLQRIKLASPRLSKKRRIIDGTGAAKASCTVLAVADGYVSEVEADDGEQDEVDGIMVLQEHVEDLSVSVCSSSTSGNVTGRRCRCPTAACLQVIATY